MSFSPWCLSEQPVCHADHPRGAIVVASFFGMFDGVLRDPPLFIEFKDKQATELFRVLSVLASKYV